MEGDITLFDSLRGIEIDPTDKGGKCNFTFFLFNSIVGIDEI